MNNANERQVGGDHYSPGGYMHWDWVLDCGMGYLECQITRYVMRWYKKDGLQDLHKALHYTDKLIEREKQNGEYNKRWDSKTTEKVIEELTERVCSQTQLPPSEKAVVIAVRDWTTSDELQEIRNMINEIAATQESFHG